MNTILIETKISDSRNAVLIDDGDVPIDLAPFFSLSKSLNLNHSLNFLSIIALNDGKGYAPSKVSALEPSFFSITKVGVP